MVYPIVRSALMQRATVFGNLLVTGKEHVERQFSLSGLCASLGVRTRELSTDSVTLPARDNWITMGSFGERLRREREMRGISLDRHCRSDKDRNSSAACSRRRAV